MRVALYRQALNQGLTYVLLGALPTTRLVVIRRTSGNVCEYSITSERMKCFTCKMGGLLECISGTASGRV